MKIKMNKQGLFHCYITCELHDKYHIITKQFHFSGNASDEAMLKNIGCVCDMLLDSIGIKHTVKYAYKPMYEKPNMLDKYDERGWYNKYDDPL